MPAPWSTCGAAGFRKKAAAQLGGLNPAKVIEARYLINLQVSVSDQRYYTYVTRILRAILESNDFEMKVSPRFTDTILSVAKAHAVFRAWRSLGKSGGGTADFPAQVSITKEDINTCAMCMLPHRVSLSYDAQARGLNKKDLVRSILRATEYGEEFARLD